MIRPATAIGTRVASNCSPIQVSYCARIFAIVRQRMIGRRRKGVGIRLLPQPGNLLQLLLAKRVEASLKLGLELGRSSCSPFEYNFHPLRRLPRPANRRAAGV